VGERANHGQVGQQREGSGSSFARAGARPRPEASVRSSVVRRATPAVVGVGDIRIVGVGVLRPASPEVEERETVRLWQR